MIRPAIRNALWLAAGPVVAAVIWLLPATGLPAGAQRVAGLAAWMAVWWIGIPVPLAVTALLPLALLPVLGQGTMEQAAKPYADPVIFLFMGGFFLGAASQKWQLHRRLALAVIGLVGAQARRLVLAVMIATAVISMWISNTATAVMMLPIAAAVLEVARREAGDGAGNFGRALMLGVAYAASIGGAATLIGTPPNAIFAAAAARVLGRPVGFAEWMALGLPIAAVLLVACWLVLARWLFPVRGELTGIGSLVDAERADVGKWTPGQVVTVAVFALAALAWVLREPKSIGAGTVPGLVDLIPGLSDAGIAMLAATLLFVIPLSIAEGRFALDWETAERIPWGVLILFGGGLALADAFQSSGLSQWIGGRLEGLAGAPPVLITAAVALLFVLLTELTSNTATAAMAMPIMASLAPALGAPPLVLMATAALAASFGFMLPVGTPPNALAYGTGAVTSREMMRAGIWMDLIAAGVITAGVSLWARG